MSLSSLGYHTFTLFLRLTVKEAIELHEAFKNHPDVTVIPPGKNKLNPDADPFIKKLTTMLPRYYKIVYPKQERGISWLLRLSTSSPGFIHDLIDDDKPCSIKATINPKILTGIKDYVTAADQSYLADAIQNFNAEASRISPILRTFDSYSLNRSDYCINFDLKELGIPCSVEQMMILIQRSNIPSHFTEWKKDDEKPYQKVHEENTFRLKNGSMTINCYGKHYQLSEVWDSCPSIDNALNVVRFEVQCEYLKMYSMLSAMRSNSGLYDSRFVNDLLSDHVSESIVRKYYNKIIRKGGYYTLSDAKQRIMNLHHFKKNRQERLFYTLELVNRCRGISKAKDALKGKELDDFKRSLRELADIGINPVTIPKEWKIKHIPNLLDAYDRKIEIDLANKWMKQQEHEFLMEYITDCNKHKKDWI